MLFTCGVVFSLRTETIARPISIFFFFASDLVLWGRRPYVGHFRHMLSIVNWGVCTVDV